MDPTPPAPPPSLGPVLSGGESLLGEFGGGKFVIPCVELVGDAELDAVVVVVAVAVAVAVAVGVVDPDPDPDPLSEKAFFKNEFKRFRIFFPTDPFDSVGRNPPAPMMVSGDNKLSPSRPTIPPPPLSTRKSGDPPWL